MRRGNYAPNRVKRVQLQRVGAKKASVACVPLESSGDNNEINAKLEIIARWRRNRRGYKIITRRNLVLHFSGASILYFSGLHLTK